MNSRTNLQSYPIGIYTVRIMQAHSDEWYYKYVGRTFKVEHWAWDDFNMGFKVVGERAYLRYRDCMIVAEKINV